MYECPFRGGCERRGTIYKMRVKKSRKHRKVIKDPAIIRRIAVVLRMASVNVGFYECDKWVNLQIFLKNAKDEKFKVEIERQRVDVLVDGVDPIKIDLRHPIEPRLSYYWANRYKIEIKLAKLEGKYWGSLSTAPAKTKIGKAERNWDKIGAEIDQEDFDPRFMTDEEKTQYRMQQEYDNSNEDEKRAIDKAYSILRNKQ